MKRKDYRGTIKVVITSGYRWSYFQWFLLGLYQLCEEGMIHIEFKIPIGSKILSKSNNKWILKFADKLRRTFEHDNYNMSGYVIFLDGNKKYFTIDSADAPYLFDSSRLEKSDVYFKMQCPIDLDNEGFSLTNDVIIPWLDHSHVDSKIKELTRRGERKKCWNFEKNKEKIKPLMVGPRALSKKGFSYQKLQEGYDNYIKNKKAAKNKYIMCYFGNAKGPSLEKNIKSPDFDWEADILTYYGKKVNHPNEKRAIVSDYIAKLPNCDARIISRGNADTGAEQQDRSRIIPIKEFCAFISDFQYNVNVSGYRRSIPNRFIESFLVGTKIITDKLAVKWYLPFEKTEVVETVEMGYLPLDKIDWKKFENDISLLSENDNSKTIKNFENKWSPLIVAKYILETIKQS